MPRKKIEPEPEPTSRVIHVRMDTDLLAEVDEYARHKADLLSIAGVDRFTRSDAFRQLLRIGLAAEKEQEDGDGTLR